MLDRYLEQQQIEDSRYFKLIDCVTAALGRTTKLEPGALFPSLRNVTVEDVAMDETALEANFNSIRALLQTGSL